MTPRPPARATQILERSLRDDPAGPAIVGDVLEDFVRRARDHGEASARRWYWQEVLRLVGRRWLRGHVAGADPRPSRWRAFATDAVHASRTIRRSPGPALFTATVIGLGVGGATAVFSVMKPFVWAPLPFEDPHELVWIQNEVEDGEGSLSALTVRSANLYDLRARGRSFEALSGFNAFFDHAAYTLTGRGEPVRMAGADVAHDFLDVLGVRPMYGRSFRPEDSQGDIGAAPVLLTHGLWTRLFGGDPAVVGSTLALDGASREIIGVLPASFDFSSVFSPGISVDLLLPFPVIADGDPGFQGNTLYLVGRLSPGVTVEAAQSETDAILNALGEETPGRWGLDAALVPLAEYIGGPFRPTLFALVGAAGLLLAIVCINLSNLALARAPRRAREVAVRKALGAPRSRLIRELLLESVGVGIVGALIGTAVAWALIGLAPRAADMNVPLLDTITIDGGALAFAIVLAVLTSSIASTLPALRVVDGSEAGTLRSGSRGQSSGRRERKTREALIVAEVSFAFALLVVCGLLGRSFAHVLDVDLGFESSDAIAWQLAPSIPFETAQAAADHFDALTDRVREVSGVEAVGLVDALPLGRNRAWPFSVIGQPEQAEERRQAFPHIVDAGYLRAMHIEIAEGRDFARSDAEATDRVVILNESGARQVFGTQSPIGEKMKFFGPWEWEVVGVARDVRHVGPETSAGIQAYFPIAQMRGFHTLDLVVRTSLDHTVAAARVGEALQVVDPSMPVRETWTLESTVDRSLSTRRFTLSVLLAFGVAALLLAGLGVYGVLAYSVAERETEMRIRMALGATAAAVATSLFGRTAFLASVGIALGAGAAASLRGVLEPLLFGVRALDPVTFGGIALLLMALALLAAAGPAGRAAKSGSALGATE
ncbi:MAG: ADOP family duplicated permease [Gemmatimonadota bacterium]